jgi:succinate dehydrogenase/fumarate reductase flavoprotein subunit
MATPLSVPLGVVRTEDEMVAAKGQLAALREEFDAGVFVEDKGMVFNSDLTYALEVGYLLEMADVLTHCAIERQESRGGHARTDFPDRDDDKWLCHSISRRTPEDATIEVGTMPVTITEHQPAVRSY